MRNFGVLSLFVVLSGCESLEPSVSLEVLSPSTGEIRSSVKFRVKQTGPVIHSTVSLMREGVEARSFTCAAAMPTCEGELEATPLEDDFEIVATIQLNDAQQTTISTAPQTVRLNGELLSLAPIGLGNPKQIIFVKGSRAAIDPASLVNVKVTREFAWLPYIDVPDIRGFGLRKEDVAVTAELRGQQLLVKGELDGPARYTVDLTGVTNVYGKHVLEPHVYEQPYFTPSIEVGDVFVSGVGTPPHFERSTDGRLFLVVNGTIRVLEGLEWKDHVQWNDASTPVLAPDGTPWLVRADDNVATVMKWNGTSWQNLPPVPVPASVSGDYNYFLINAAFTAAGTLYVATSRAKSVPYVTHSRIFRLENDQWVEVTTRQYSGTGFGHRFDLTRFEDSVALIIDGRFERLTGTTFAPIADPMSVLAVQGPHAAFFTARPVHDVNGKAWLLGTYEDETQLLDDVTRRLSGTALLRFEAGQWVVAARGNVLAEAWGALSNGSALNIKQVLLRSFGFDRDGAPMVFARETVNLFGTSPEFNRFNISAYVLRDGKWGPMRGARSPLLSDELQLLPNPYPPMAPVVAYDAAYDSAGHLWTVNQVGSHGGSVATSTFVVSYRQ